MCRFMLAVILTTTMVNAILGAPTPDPVPEPQPAADPAPGPKPGLIYTQPVALSYTSLQAHPAPLASVSVKTAPVIASVPLTYSYPYQSIGYAVNYPYVII